MLNGLFAVDTWDYTKLKEVIDSLTGAVIRRRAQHVIVFDPATGEPIAFSASGGGLATGDPRLDRLAEIRDRLGLVFPSGTSSLVALEPIELEVVAKPLSDVSFLCRSVQIQAVRPDGSDNLSRIAVGTEALQIQYLDPSLGTWGDTAPMGQTLDLAQIYVRAITAGDYASVVVRV